MAILKRFAAKIRQKFDDADKEFIIINIGFIAIALLLFWWFLLIMPVPYPEQKVETTAEVVSVGDVLEAYDARGITVRFIDAYGCQREVGVLVDKSTDFKAGDFFVFCYNLTTADFANSAAVFEISENNGSYNMEKR